MKLPLKMCIVYASLIGVLLLVTLHMEPRFNYTLDDPYIHLALAQSIAHGTYGINPGETTSPSSSVIWPFLLAPFSHTAFRYWVALIENVVFGMLLCVLLGVHMEAVHQKLKSVGERWGMAVLLVLACNMVGLAFVGMEHTLQVLVCAGCGIAMVHAAQGRRIGPILLLCALLAPAVRYEDVLFTAGVAVVLFLQKRRVVGVGLMVASLVPLAGLGYFLHLRGLGPIPNSVIAKSGIVTAHSHLFPHHLQLDRAMVVGVLAWRSLIVDPERVPVLLLLAAFCVQVYRSRRSTEFPFVLTGLAIVILTITFAPFGWFYRYDVALRVFLLIMVVGLSHLWRSAAIQRLWLWLAPVSVAAVFLVALIRTPAGSQAIASQQFQMHRLVHDYVRANVAVDDLGWVACDSDGSYYILDLLGLGSNETLHVAARNPVWLDSITTKHGTELAMVYSYPTVPDQWILLGTLRHKHTISDIIPRAVQLYAVKPEHADAMRLQVQAFAATLPPSAWLEAPPVKHLMAVKTPSLIKAD